MKRRLISMILATVMIFTVAAIPAMAAEEVTPRYSPCLYCTGRVATVAVATGYEEDAGYSRVCSIDSRFNCPIVRVQYQDVMKCLSCQYVYGTSQPYMKEVQRHWNHSC